MLVNTRPTECLVMRCGYKLGSDPDYTINRYFCAAHSDMLSDRVADSVVRAHRFYEHDNEGQQRALESALLTALFHLPRYAK